MTYKVEEIDNKRIVHLDGEIDMEVADKARNTILPLIEAGNEVQLNLSKVEYFEKNKTIDGHDHNELLKIESLSSIEDKLTDLKVPLVNKNSLHLSATQFRNYMECSKKYKFNYVLKVPQPSQTFFALGNVVHKIFEKL